MEKKIDITKTQKNLRQKIKDGSVGIFDGEIIFKMPFENLFTIGERGVERILLPKNEEDFKVVMEHITIDGGPVEIFYKEIVVVEKKKIEYGICPICNGTKRKGIEEVSRPYVGIIFGYDKETDTLPCSNCGAQYQWGKPSGNVRLREDGTPCIHEYDSLSVGRCLTQHTCKHCKDSYQIDSGD